MPVLRAAPKVLLVLATLVCLSSMGGAMLYAFPVLVPLHWLASRGSGPSGMAGWALLAGSSLFEAGWMLTYIATDDVGASLAAGGLLGLVTAVSFVWSRSSSSTADGAVLRHP